MTREDVAEMTSRLSKIKKFLAAQSKAESKGEKWFTCPLCGERAWWGRAQGNNHLHTECEGCGMQIAE